MKMQLCKINILSVPKQPLISTYFLIFIDFCIVTIIWMFRSGRKGERILRAICASQRKNNHEVLESSKNLSVKKFEMHMNNPHAVQKVIEQSEDQSL